jgi:maleamate amidohydrolase
MRPWDHVIPAEEQRRYESSGFGRPSGLGDRPALLIIDVQYRTVGLTSKPFWEAIKDFPTACGEDGWNAVAKIAPLLRFFRARNWPVIYPCVAPKDKRHDAGRLAEKVPAIMNIPQQGYEFVPDIAPRESDLVIPKKHPSAFFATALASHLIDLRVDTLVLTGCTTSGCVRGTAVDGFAYNFKITVPEDCVYDRSPTSHAVNLFDMASKYADVLPSSELMRRLESLKQAA